MIGVIDIGVGNIGSVANMLRYMGENVVITSNEKELSACKGLILPGVGSFDHMVSRIDATKGLRGYLREWSFTDKMLMGICLGAQVMFDASEEGEREGLSLIEGSCKMFSQTVGETMMRLPLIGWYEVVIDRSVIDVDHARVRFYHVHKYYFHDVDNAQVIGKTLAPITYPSIVKARNTYAVQFHPEKSHKYGISLMSKFVEKCNEQRI